MAYSDAYRRTLLTRAAEQRRPVTIDYHGASTCAGLKGTIRVIEIRSFRTSEAGNTIIGAWCRACERRENFRLDWIASHRSHRRPGYIGSQPKITAQTTAFDPTPMEERDLPPCANGPSTAYSLLPLIRDKVSSAADFEAVFGPAETYPRHRTALSTSGLLSEMRANIAQAPFVALFGWPSEYPARKRGPWTAGDYLKKWRRDITAVRDFENLFGPMEAYPRRRAGLSAAELLTQARSDIARAHNGRTERLGLAA